MLFEKKIALFHQNPATKEEALKLLADEFVKAGVVQDNYLEGLLKREANFPTGLEAELMGVAIPHTDPEYVKENQLGFMTLDNPVVFQNMADPEQTVEVKMIFMMAIMGHDQVEMLMKLMGIFMDNDLCERLSKVDNYDEFYAIVKEAGLVEE